MTCDLQQIKYGVSQGSVLGQILLRADILQKSKALIILRDFSHQIWP